MQDSVLHERHRPAHGVQISLTEPVIVWLTVCTRNRQSWLNCDEAHERLVTVWRNADAWLVGRYMLMPDHLHLFCAPRDLEISLDAWVKYWKSQFTKQAKRPEWRWQTGHWDTRLRRHESYTEKWLYTSENPVRAQWVSHTNDWPWQGELNALRW